VHRLSAGDAVLFTSHGTYSLGFKAEAGQICEVLIWTWRTPPPFHEVRPALSGYHICHMGSEAFQRLRAIHALCRSEVARRDSFTERLLRGLRAEIDTEFARAIARGKAEPSQQLRVEDADRWLHAHLDRENPIFELCDFLQVSHSTLGRMFRSAFGETARAHLHRLRMEAAVRLLGDGELSVKQVAYQLGYKQPNDFSRAFGAFRRKAERRR
jgi:AraC-like DNA-binding protein